MSSLFEYKDDIKLLDAGAGIGSLTSAFLKRAVENNCNINVDLWEIDSNLIEHLEKTINQWISSANIKINKRIFVNDFIDAASYLIEMGGDSQYSHAILNPPYKKIKSDSEHKKWLRKAGVETVNLYSAFVALTIKLLKDKGELVAILPRSFCNGAYYLSFRNLLLNETAIRQIHLFHSRNHAFKDDNVLQENIIIHLVKNTKTKEVIISTSSDSTFTDYEEQIFDVSSIVDLGSKNRFINIPTNQYNHELPDLCTYSLNDIGLEVSTGPIVDFRMKKYLHFDISSESVPVLYPFNFTKGQFQWPLKHKKPNAIIKTREVNQFLMPNDNYVLVKRFSSKEEKKRLVAFYLPSDALATEEVGFENHLNVFHFGKKGLDEYLARGLTIFLNSTMMDNRFRVFSGHTQVNATDLRALRYPSKEKLLELGKKSINYPNTQSVIDSLVGETIK